MLVAAKCTQCGANIQVDSTHEAGICPHCGTAFITAKAVTNYNTTYVTNTSLCTPCTSTATNTAANLSCKIVLNGVNTSGR